MERSRSSSSLWASAPTTDSRSDPSKTSPHPARFSANDPLASKNFLLFREAGDHVFGQEEKRAVRALKVTKNAKSASPKSVAQSHVIQEMEKRKAVAETAIAMMIPKRSGATHGGASNLLCTPHRRPTPA